MLIGGLSCGIASSVLNPIDMIKIRIQNQGQEIIYKGMTSGILKVFKEEGMAGMTRGIYATWLREMTYSSARMGLYDPIRNFLAGGDRGTNSEDMNPLVKLMAGFISGTIGSAICNPCDLIKTRQQQLYLLDNKFYNSSNFARHIGDFNSVYKANGFIGLYKGWQITCVRAAMLTSAQLGTYDTIKNNIFKKYFKLEDGILLHICASMTAAIFTTAASNPFDVIKTKYMCDNKSLYSSVSDCAIQTFKNEGILGFTKGMIPAYSRFGPHTVISLVLMEQIRSLLGYRLI
jgi:hypothetical protein